MKGLLLRFVEDSFKDDEEIVYEAIFNNSFALEVNI